MKLFTTYFFSPFLGSSLLNPDFIGLIILGEFNVKVGQENIFKLTIGNEVYIRIVTIMVFE